MLGVSTAVASVAAHAAAPPADPLSVTVAVNDVLSYPVAGGVIQPAPSTSPDAVNVKVSYFSASTDGANIDITAVSPGPTSPGFTTTYTVNLFPPGSDRYQIAAQPDGSVAVAKSTDGGATWAVVAPAALDIDGPSAHFRMPTGDWTVPGTTAAVRRMDVDAGNNGFENTTDEALLVSLLGQAAKDTVLLNPQGNVVGSSGVTNERCTVAGLPTAATVTPDAVTFTFAGPPPPNLAGTVGGAALADFTTFLYASGSFESGPWKGFDGTAPLGDFAVTVQGNDVTVATSNATGSLHDGNHNGVILGIADVGTACYVLYPAFPLAVLDAQPVAPTPTVTTAPADTTGTASTVTPAASTPAGVPASADSVLTSTQGGAATAPSAEPTGSDEPEVSAVALTPAGSKDSNSSYAVFILVGLVVVCVAGIGVCAVALHRRRVANMKYLVAQTYPPTASVPLPPAPPAGQFNPVGPVEAPRAAPPPDPFTRPPAPP